MTPRIKSIHVSNLRGIRDLTIPLNRGENLLVIGDNGSGKSSIVDAIELFFKGEIQKISGRNDISANDCVPYKDSGPGECYVDILFDGAENPLRAHFIRSNNGKSYYPPADVPPQLASVLEFAKSRPFILHRAQLTQFIESRPANRYESISQLIGLGSIDSIINLWKKERTTRSSNNDKALERYQRISKQIIELLGEPVVSDEDILRVINSRLGRLGFEKIDSRPELPARLNSIRYQALTPSHNQELLSTLQDVVRTIQRVHSTHADFLAAFEEQSRHIQQYQEKARQQSDSDFIEVIEESERLILQKDLDYCPVCEQHIEATDLLERLRERRQLLQELVLERSLLEDATKDCQTALSVFVNFWKEFIDLSAKVEIELPRDLLLTEPFFQNLYSVVSDQRYSIDTIRRESSAFAALIKPFDEIYRKVEKRIADLAPSDNERDLVNASYEYGQLDSMWGEWNRARTESLEASAKYEMVHHIHAQLIEARRKVVNRIVSELGDDFIRLYEKLHPGEGHKAIQIILVESRDSSADLRAEVEEMPAMHPLGHFSEGHLDSLGLCIFLAFIKRFHQDFRLIVLDDVLTSIDSGHRMKVAQLIAKEFSDFQILLTTHDEMWANELAILFRKEQIPLKTIRMNYWTKENGATYDEYVASKWDHYKELVRNGHRQDAIGGVGRNLEQFLFSMRRNLHLAVPATTDDRYTLIQILPIFLKWTSDHKIERPDIEDIHQQLTLVREELEAYWSLRNWSGAHYNEWGATVSTEEALDFVSIVEELVGYFQCPACSCLVVYDTVNRYLRCPICEPKPAKTTACMYKAEWRNKAERLQANHANLQNANEYLLRQTQSAFEKMLIDSRRYLRLMVPPTMDDRYSIRELFVPFRNQLREYPNLAHADWEESVPQSCDTLETFLCDDHSWQEPDILVQRADAVFGAVATIIDAVSCPTCKRLLTLDCVARTYSCPECKKDKEMIGEAPALWIVK